MPTPSKAALADCLETADRAAVVAFVAALSAARGATVERQPAGDADLVLVDGDTSRRVAVHTDPDEPVPAVETVVAVSETPPATDATVRTVDDLHAQLWYAIPRDRAEDLLATHFGRDLASLTDATPAATDGEGAAGAVDEAPETDGPATGDATRGGSDDGRDGGRDAERSEASTREAASGETASEADEEQVRDREGAAVSGSTSGTGRGAAAVVRDGADGTSAPAGTGSSGVERVTIPLGLIAVVVVLAAVATGPGVPLGSTLLEAVGGGGATEDPVVADGPTFSRSAIDVNATALPPGVAPSGEMDERELAAATTAALENTSYRLTLTYREFGNGEATGVYSEVLRVEDGRTYRTDVRRVGDLVQTPPAIAETDRYANGTVSLRHADNETTVTTGALSPTDPFQDELAQYLRWYLSVDASRITDRTGTGDATTYRIATNGDPYTGVTNTTGSALVTRDGLVWSVRRSYDDPSHRDLRAVVTIRISGIGSTTAPEPDWVE